MATLTDEGTAGAGADAEPLAGDDDVEDVEADACCICQEFVNVLAQGFLPACDHRFHFDCILSWAKVTNLCPLCRAKFNLITRVDADGKVVHREKVADVKQVFRPDPSDHDIAAQLRLVSEAHCQICGSGDDEHVLLMCEAPGCAVSNHTYCIGLRAVPHSAWYCSLHSSADARAASDLIERPATTVSTRRRTRRLATLMSNVLNSVQAAEMQEPGRGNRRRGRQGSGASNAVEGRPIRGAAAGYALRMSRELEMVQRRADAMFARGDLNQPSLYESPSRANRSAYAGTRSTSAGLSSIDQMWEDHDRSRREIITLIDEEEKNDIADTTHSPERNRISKTLLPEFRELEKLMLDAVSHDNYASSVTLLIPKTAKLRLVSRVKAFFTKLNEREALKVLELGCLSIIHKWVKSPDDSPPNPQVLDAVLIVLDTLPIKKAHLEEETGFVDTINQLARSPAIGGEHRGRVKAIRERLIKLLPPPPSNDQTRAVPDWREQQRELQARETAEESQLPQIAAFSIQRAKGKRKRQQEGWVEPVVEYVKGKLYPLYKDGGANGSPKLSKERFKSIVKEVTSLFKKEATSFQSPIMSSGALSNLAKDRLRKLIDQVYKSSKGKPGHGTSAVALAPMLTTSYSARPPSRPR